MAEDTLYNGFGGKTDTEAKMMMIAVSDKILSVPQPARDQVRASIFKNMILILVGSD